MKLTFSGAKPGTRARLYHGCGDADPGHLTGLAAEATVDEGGEFSFSAWGERFGHKFVAEPRHVRCVAADGTTRVIRRVRPPGRIDVPPGAPPVPEEEQPLPVASDSGGAPLPGSTAELFASRGDAGGLGEKVGEAKVKRDGSIPLAGTGWVRYRTVGGGVRVVHRPWA